MNKITAKGIEMPETPSQMLKNRKEMLARIQSDLESKGDSEPEIQKSEHLLELAIDKLVERERLSSFTGKKDKFSSKPLGNETAMADGFGLSFYGENDDEVVNVDVFVVDPYIPADVEQLETQKLARLFRKARGFIEYLKNGTLEREVPEQHPSKQTEHAVYEAVCQGSVREWRIWIVTASVWKTVGEKAIPVPEKELSDATIEVLDLDFFRMEEDSGISQKFNAPGLPCIAFEDSKTRGYSCYLTAVTGDILADLYHKHGTGLVEENVRAYLGNNKVNKQVKETIKNNPEYFLAFNNGLVISAGKVVCQESGAGNASIFEINQMQVINGGQTTVSIYQSLYNTTKARKEEMRRSLENLCVPVKIVVPDADLDDNEKRMLRSRISQAANSQTAVKTSDLAANELFQINFAKIVQNLKTSDNDYWFYDRARGLYRAELGKKKYSEKKLWESEHPSKKVFDKTNVSSAWLAWNGYPVACAQGKEVAFNFFREKLLDPKENLPKPEYGLLNESFAKKLICQLFIMRELEKTIGSAAVSRDMRIQNPRVPVIYTIYLFSRTFGAYIDWDLIWQYQHTPGQMLTFLLNMTRRVDKILREEMGSVMISMWGRKAICQDTLVKRFNYQDIEFNPEMDGLKLPSDFMLPQSLCEETTALS